MEDAKDLILLYCEISALVYQERIEDEMYRELSVDGNISSDLVELSIEIYRKHFLNSN